MARSRGATLWTERSSEARNRHRELKKATQAVVGSPAWLARKRRQKRYDARRAMRKNGGRPLMERLRKLIGSRGDQDYRNEILAEAILAVAEGAPVDKETVRKARKLVSDRVYEFAIPFKENGRKQEVEW